MYMYMYMDTDTISPENIKKRGRWGQVWHDMVISCGGRCVASVFPYFLALHTTPIMHIHPSDDDGMSHYCTTTTTTHTTIHHTIRL